MPTLWIREYDQAGKSQSGELLQIPLDGDATFDQTVTFTTSTQSAAFKKNTKFIEFISSSAFHYKIGTNPTATTSSMYVAADTAKFIGLQQQDLKIAAVAAA